MSECTLCTDCSGGGWWGAQGTSAAGVWNGIDGGCHCHEGRGGEASQAHRKAVMASITHSMPVGAGGQVLLLMLTLSALDGSVSHATGGSGLESAPRRESEA